MNKMAQCSLQSQPELVLDLFDIEDGPADISMDAVSSQQSDDLSGFWKSYIPGLEYQDSFITEEEEQKIASLIDKQPWLCEFERRVQHYGYKYNYKSRRIDESMNLGELPKWLRYLCHLLLRRGIFDTLPDQVIVNEYFPGQGISLHVDCEPCFGDTIASLSILSGCVMDFVKVGDTSRVSLPLKQRSLVVMKGESRHQWKHGIAKRTADQIHNVSVPRSRRISLTFRNVIANGK